MSLGGPVDGPCPDRDELSAYRRGTLPPGAAVRIASHLSHCPACSARLGELGTRAGGATNTPPVTAVLTSPPSKPPGPGPWRVGRYRLQARIGSGGMGTVYKAWHERLKRWVAVKVLPPARSSDPTWVARFAREMEVVGRLDHPHIVRATDAGEDNGVHYLVMELIDGVDLGRLVREVGPLPPAEAAELARQAALGLQHAHEHGLVHRDVKPQNLMLTARGGVKVLDLGLAQFREPGAGADALSGVGLVMGTPDYMAPEQWDDFRGVDGRADLYALGCTLYHLLAGRPPFVGRGWAGSRAGDALTPPPLGGSRADLPPPLEALVARLMTPDPAGRPASAAETAGLLGPLAEGADLPSLLGRVPRSPSPSGTEVTGGWQPAVGSSTASDPPRRAPRRARLVAGGAVLAVVAAAAGLLLLGNGRPGDAGQAAGGQPPSFPEPAAPPPPTPNEWTGLLKTAPAPRVWKAMLGARLDHEAKSESLSIQAFSPALIPLGRTDARAYRLQVTFRQVIWTGGIGVYFGGREEGDGRFRGQLIDLREHLPAAGQPFALLRETVTVAGKGATPLTHGFASKVLTRPLGIDEQLVELTVAPRGLKEVRWNGDPCPELNSDAANGRFGEGDYTGEFGIYCFGGATFVSAARFMPMN